MSPDEEPSKQGDKVISLEEERQKRQPADTADVEKIFAVAKEEGLLPAHIETLINKWKSDVPLTAKEDDQVFLYSIVLAEKFEEMYKKGELPEKLWD